MKSSFPLLLWLVAGCKSPSEKIVEDFRKVDEELVRSARADSLSQKMKFIGFDQKVSDSLQGLLNDASDYLTRLKKIMDSQDANGERLDVAEKILIGTAAGDSLFYYVDGVYNAGIKYGDSSLRKDFIQLRRTADKGRWLEQYFRKIPTYGAKTILSKFQNDLLRIRMGIFTQGIGALRDTILSQ